MVNVREVRTGNLIVHKDVGVCLVVGIVKNSRNPSKSIISACDVDDSIYEGPCSDWFNLWASVKEVEEYGIALKEKNAKFNSKKSTTKKASNT
ncbi:MAG: hypothetical protein RSC28_05595 [Bacteroidales bacterium]